MSAAMFNEADINKVAAGKVRHTLVVGASRGLGHAIARSLGEDGHRMSLAARSYNRLLGETMSIGQDHVFAQQMDLADISSIGDSWPRQAALRARSSGLMYRHVQRNGWASSAVQYSM